MMDELELLKQDWQRREAQLPTISQDEISIMIWKKSSSIVRWILIISVLEFILPHSLYLIPAVRSSINIYDALGLRTPIIVLSIIQYAFIVYFIYLFYKRFKEISVLDDAKSLMGKIIKTRKTLKYYIIFSLIMIFMSFLMCVFGVYMSSDLNQLMTFTDNPDILNQSPQQFKLFLMLVIGITGVLTIALIGGLYFLVYGRLLKKMNKNYLELEKIEV